MATGLSPENEQFIQNELASGVYRDRNELLDASVELLKKKKSLAARINEGSQQLASGEYTEYDDRSLAERFEELKKQARTVVSTDQ